MRGKTITEKLKEKKGLYLLRSWNASEEGAYRGGKQPSFREKKKNTLGKKIEERGIGERFKNRGVDAILRPGGSSMGEKVKRRLGHPSNSGKMGAQRDLNCKRKTQNQNPKKAPKRNFFGARRRGQEKAKKG